MSLFKAKEWWSSGTVLEEETTDILSDTMRLAQLGPEGSGDMIVFGSPAGLISIFRPQGAYQPTDVVLEYPTNKPILQIECGKLTPGTMIESIAVLHPRNISVYILSSKEGHAEYGDQNILFEQYEHKLPRTAYCFVIGPFGGVKNKDFMCVQSMDGLLIFYEQDVATFTCFLPSILIPGPLAYSHCMDIFITCSSNWIIEAYSYYNLSHTSDAMEEKQSSRKKLVPNWTYNVGENIINIQTIQTHNNTCCFIMMGERYLYCLHDNGILKFMKKFDFSPVCCLAYLIGWYYENNARLMIAVVSDLSTLYIYEQITLLWSCQLTFMPLCIKRGFFPSLPGALVLLTDFGELKCCYLGTEPELFSAPPLPNSDIDFNQAQEELDRLQSVIHSQNDLSEIQALNQASERELNIQILINKNLELNETLLTNQESRYADVIEHMALKCKVEIRLKPTDRKNIEFIQVTFMTIPPLICNNEVQHIADVEEENIVETYIYFLERAPASSLSLHVLIMYANKNGNMRVLQREERLPFKLACYPTRPSKEAKYKVTVSTEEQLTVDFMEIYKDFDQELLSGVGSSSGVVAFSCANTDDYTVTLISAKSSSQRYRLQCNDLAILSVVLEEFNERLLNRSYKDKLKTTNKKRLLKIDFNNDVSSEIVKHFSQVIERHVVLRQKLLQFEIELDTLSSQFILIQKKLMSKFKERAPSSCEGLHFLLEDTHSKIQNTTRGIQKFKEELKECSYELSSIIELLITLLKMTAATNDELEIFKSCISYQKLQAENPNWEENVGRNIYHLLSTKFIKNEKDRDKLLQFDAKESLDKFDTPRLIKYLNILIDNVFKRKEKSEVNKRSDTENNDEVEPVQQISTSKETVDPDKGMFKLPEGSLYGHRTPILTARWEKQNNAE